MCCHDCRHHIYMYLYHRYTDTLVHWILLFSSCNTVARIYYHTGHCHFIYVSLLYRSCYTRHYSFMFMYHWYTDTLLHLILCFHIFVSSLHGYSIYRYIKFIQPCYKDSLVHMHWLFLLSCRMGHYSYYMNYCYMYIHTFPLHDCFSLLDMWVVDMRCVELSTTWIQAMGVTSRIPHLLFSIFCYLVLCYQQSSCPGIVLNVPWTVLVLDTLCSLNIINITWD